MRFKFTFFLLFFLPVFHGYSIEITKFWIIEQDNGKLNLMVKKEQLIFKTTDMIYFLLDFQKAVLKEKKGSVRWYFEFYIEGTLNTRLKPEVKEIDMDGESWNYWRVFSWKLPKLSGNYKVLIYIQDLMSRRKDQKTLYFRVLD